MLDYTGRFVPEGAGMGNPFMQMAAPVAPQQPQLPPGLIEMIQRALMANPGLIRQLTGPVAPVGPPIAPAVLPNPVPIDQAAMAAPMPAPVNPTAPVMPTMFDEQLNPHRQSRPQQTFSATSRPTIDPLRY